MDFPEHEYIYHFELKLSEGHRTFVKCLCRRGIMLEEERWSSGLSG